MEYGTEKTHWEAAKLANTNRWPWNLPTWWHLFNNLPLWSISTALNLVLLQLPYLWPDLPRKTQCLQFCSNCINRRSCMVWKPAVSSAPLGSRLSRSLALSSSHRGALTNCCLFQGQVDFVPGHCVFPKPLLNIIYCSCDVPNSPTPTESRVCEFLEHVRLAVTTRITDLLT